MDLKSGYPFWAVKNGLMHAFPRLHRDLRCETVVLGGGITGAVIADELSRHGHEVVVLDGRDVGWGSTAASTALLQYEIDTHLVDLAKLHGEEQAVLAYRACATAIPKLQALAKRVRDVGFERNDSLYFASRARDLRGMREEFELRKRHRLPVHWLEADAVMARYGIEAPGAILSTLAARFDPYRCAYRLLMRLEKQGVGVYDHTPVELVQAGARGVELRTDEGVVVRCQRLVVAAGYAGQRWLKQRVARNRSTYAFVTDSIGVDELGALDSTLLWESARPYLYTRSTIDHRLMVGGEDDAVDVPSRRDARVDAKARRLCQRVTRMFPRLRLNPAFAWAGTFAETKDGLPFFGPHPQHGPRVHFAMAYGGNGITYAMVGAELVRALVERRRHPLKQLFSFQRLER